MEPLRVSIIIPTYNGADYLGEAIQSILDQHYPHYEIVVVNDASPDNTEQIIAQFDDPRLKYIVHESNRGARSARRTGIEASNGEIIAFLDQDDTFHPEKLMLHVAFLEQHPQVGATYNSRFDLNYSSETIRGIWQPPLNLTLADLILGFPIAPSDLVLRRDWAFRMVEIQGEASYFHGGEILSYGRLYLAGCKFAMIDRALNFHRYHSGRKVKNIAKNCHDYLSAQKKILADPGCPPEVLALENQAFANSYVVWACYAFAQQETKLGQQFVKEAIKLNPSMLEGKPGALIRRLITFSIADDSLDHETLLISMFDQLPTEFQMLSRWKNWAVGRGYLARGARAILWDRPEDGRKYFEQAIELNAEIDESFLRNLIHHLVNYEKEFGAEVTDTAIQKLVPYLEMIGHSKDVRWLHSRYAINGAFREYQAGEYSKVPKQIIRAIKNDPTYLSNRGVLAILVRSLGTQLKLRRFST